MLTSSAIAALRPTARVSRLGPVGVTVVLGAAPAAVVAATRASALPTSLVLAAVVAGASLGWAGEDPAAEVLAPLPVSSPVRASLRVLFAVGVALALWSVLVLGVWLGPGIPTGLADRVPEALVAAAAAITLAWTLVRRGERGIGAAGVGAGLLVPVFVAVFAVRWPRVFPGFTAGPVHDRWWLLAMVLTALAVWAGRDPGRR